MEKEMQHRPVVKKKKKKKNRMRRSRRGMKVAILDWEESKKPKQKST